MRAQENPRLQGEAPARMTYTDVYTDTYGSGMALRRMFDAAYPPTSPPNWEAVAFYLGGNTPHVWTDSEIERQPARWRLPIFVRSHDGDPLADQPHVDRVAGPP